MILEDVDLADSYYDDRRLAGSATRSMRITTDAGSLATPARMVSRSEHLSRSAIPLSRELPPELAVDFKVLADRDVGGLTADGNVAERLNRRTRQFHSITEGAVLRMSMFQPTQRTLDRLSAPAKIRFADAQAEYLQDGLGCGIVTYPYLDLAAGDYLQFIGERHTRGGDATTIFVLDMNMGRTRLERILDGLEERGPSIVPLIHRTSDRAIPSYDAIRGRLDRPKMAFLSCHVPRETASAGGGNGGHSASGLHAACFQRGFDMVAPMQHPPFPPPRRGPRPAATGIRMFSPATWEIEALADALASRGLGIADEFRLNEHNEPDRRRIAAMLEGHREADADPRKYDQLRHLARVHEAIASSAEFDRVRAAIGDRALGEHVSRTSLSPLVRGGDGAGGGGQARLPGP